MPELYKLKITKGRYREYTRPMDKERAKAETKFYRDNGYHVKTIKINAGRKIFKI